MFRISRYLKMADAGSRRFSGHGGASRKQAPPIVIWNLTRTCNLECLYCYASSASHVFSRELTTKQAFSILNDLKEAGVNVLILSGGEPMLRFDLAEVAFKAKEMGFSVALSTNGTLIGDKEVEMISSVGFDYVGVSLDGDCESHDKVRGIKGAYDLAVAGLLRLRDKGIRTGVRLTLTKMNAGDVPKIFRFVEEHEIGKLYLSHLVYSGRGSANKAKDLSPHETRKVMEYVYSKAMEYSENGSKTEIVTGNNDADAVFMFLKLQEDAPELAKKLAPALIRFGGNSAGIGIANIDPNGEVHPDPLMSSVNLGNATKESFGKIWFENSHPLLKRLRERPRRLHGRCGECAWIGICGGNTRVRAERLTGDLWGSDPACYLTDEEVKVKVPHAG